MVQPRPDGREAARAATIALEDAAVDPADIDYVNAHASSTPTRRRRRGPGDLDVALGARATTVPVSGTKALLRAPAGRLGRHRGCHLCACHRRGWAPASINLREPDPDVAALLPGLLRDGRDGTYRRVLSTSFGFGGLNAALVFGAPEG